MDFRNYVPPEFYWIAGLILLLGGSWVVVLIYWLATHVSIGWQ